MSAELASLDALALARRLRAGELSPTELVDHAIARIERIDREIRSVVTPLYDQARAAARARPPGPYGGIPTLLKDLGATSAGDPLHAGSAALARRGHRATGDSHVVAKLRAAGFVILGKSATPEFGLLPTTEPLFSGPTRNPYDLARSAGGSSGGAAAAVAAGLVPVAHGSDGGGSIRIPASCCGLVGLKPSRGRVSLGPDRSALGAGLVTEGALTRSVGDAAALLDVLAGPMPGDPAPLPPPAEPFLAAASREPPRLRVAVVSSFFGPAGAREGPASACGDAIDAAVRLLEGEGHRVEDARFAPLEDPDYPRVFQRLWAKVASESVLEWSRVLGEPLAPSELEPTTRALTAIGDRLSARDGARAWSHVRDAARRGAALWERFDVLLTPTLAEPPPPLGYFTGPDAFDRAARFSPYTAALNVSGEPAISLPLGSDPAGLPVGVQLAAPLGGEALLLAVAAQLERARPFEHAAIRA